jgi:MSHA pilin protein MshD
MNTGQSILTIGAMLLLSVLVLRVNSTLFYSGNVVSTSKLGLIAISLAQSRLEEIKSKAFDETSVSSAISSTSSFTTAAKLGPDGTETYPNFDDIDDYNGFTKADTIIINPNLPKSGSNLEYFNESCSVVYVTSANPDVVYGTQTWNKRITVYVAHKLSTDTIKVSTVFSYWVFR